MTSIIVPPVDLAPGLPSRVVTISATDVTEGGTSMAGATVAFALSSTLDASGGVVVARTSALITLDAQGKGQIRLPVYDTAASQTWCNDDNWAIIVSTSWGDRKAVRVPAGTTSIPLSSLPPVRPLRGRELQWAITGVSVSVTEGAQWDASVSLSGGVLDFDFIVPPGGTAFWKGSLDPSVDLDTVTTPGLYGVWSGSPNAPGSGLLLVSEVRTTGGVVSQVNHVFYLTGSSPQIMMRFRGSVWAAWTWVGGKDAMRVQQWGNTGDLNDATAPGVYPYWSGTANAPGGSGVVVTSELRTNAGTLSQVQQIAFTTGSNPEIHMRFRGSVWAAWTRMDAGAIVIPPSEGGGGAAFRRVPLALTTATATGEESVGGGAIRFPLDYAPRVGRWRLHIRNHNYASNTSYQSGGQVTGVWIGPGWGGAFTTAPSQVSGALTIPTDGSEVVTPWINAPFGDGVQQMLSVGWSAPTDTPHVLVPGGGWRSTSAASASAASGAGFSATAWIPFDWWIEAEAAPDVPTKAGWGNSITAGTGTTLIVNDSWLSQHCRATGALPIHWAYPGSGMSLWMNPQDPKWSRWADFPKADVVIHAMGQNDLGTAASAQVMRDRFETTLPMVREHISPTVVVSTITPHAGKTEAQNAIRRQHATYLKSLPLGVRDCFDFAAAVSNDDVALRPEFRGGPAGTDELHPNTAGAAAMAAAITRPIVASPAADALAAYESAIGA
ncbi:GDSL-type esterase/lipase family protein [Brachybacterium hainanense]|uniref:GDSL-type esterase/lipase family protein n=1 Tax=Brachybacterium hainanense TaxID=1541174 RepID=A0ABV6R990_9MICO